MPNPPVPPNISRTTILVNERLPKDLANIVLGYFISTKRSWEFIYTSGEYETCMGIDYLYFDISLYGACRSNHMELVNLLIPKLVKSESFHEFWNFGLYGACRGGHMELAQLMISKGANDWNGGLLNACHNNHMELVQLMISRGATRCGCRRPIYKHR